MAQAILDRIKLHRFEVTLATISLSILVLLIAAVTGTWYVFEMVETDSSFNNDREVLKEEYRTNSFERSFQDCDAAGCIGYSDSRYEYHERGQVNLIIVFTAIKQGIFLSIMLAIGMLASGLWMVRSKERAGLYRIALTFSLLLLPISLIAPAYFSAIWPEAINDPDGDGRTRDSYDPSFEDLQFRQGEYREQQNTRTTVTTNEAGPAWYLSMLVPSLATFYAVLVIWRWKQETRSV